MKSLTKQEILNWIHENWERYWVEEVCIKIKTNKDIRKRKFKK